MQKWEYIYLANSDKSFFINGVEYKYSTGENIFTVMEKLGKEGWELVTQPSIATHTFKRPLNE